MKARRLSLLALFIALSVIGAYIKIPAIIGSVALDFFPALLAAVLIGKRSGAIIAGFGHLLSSFLVGMPLGPLHVIIAIEMAVIAWIFSLIYRSGKIKLSGLFIVISNGFIAPLPMGFLLGIGFYVALVPSLLIGSFINAVVAILFIPRFEGLFKRMLQETQFNIE